jgi:zinc protease
MSINNRQILKCILLSIALIYQSFASAEQIQGKYIHEKQLNNGLRVIVKEDHRSPTVAHMVWYKTGSVDEDIGVTGVAHVLEHMMFKGTKTIGPGEFSKRVAALGGRENAFTSNDYTAYFQQIEKSHLAKVMQLEADRMHNLELSDEEFKKEIQVIMEERRLRTDDKAPSLLYEQFMATALNAAPNRHPVIGWMNDLKNMSYKDARDWYESWYTPKNAVLLVVGDVNPNDVFALAENIYGKIPAKEIKERKLKLEPSQQGRRYFELSAPAENSIVMLGWKVPKIENSQFSDVDPFAIEVLTGVLDGNQNSRLNRQLVIDKKIVSSIGTSYEGFSRGQSMLNISGVLLPGKTPEMFEAEVKRILKEIAQNGVKPEELKRVKIAVTAAQVYKKDSVFGQAMEIGGLEMHDISWRQIDMIDEKLQSITSAQVQEVVKKYISDSQLTVGVLKPVAIKKASSN